MIWNANKHRAFNCAIVLIIANELFLNCFNFSALASLYVFTLMDLRNSAQASANITMPVPVLRQSKFT